MRTLPPDRQAASRPVSTLRHFCVRHETLCVGVLATLVFLLGIGAQPFLNFETRFAVFAQEMLRNGPSLFPTTYGQPYPDYPATSTFLIWLFAWPFGELSQFSAVLPTALCSAWIVALSYRLLLPYSRRWALLTVGFEFLTLTFVAEARSISIDQMVSAISLTAIYSAHRAYREKTPAPNILILFLLVAGFLLRGPMGLVIPAGVVLAHQWLTAGWRVAFRLAVYSALTLLLCALILFGLSAWLYDPAFIEHVIKMQVANRFSDGASLPVYYYFTSSLGNYALAYPIALLGVLGLGAQRFQAWRLRQKSVCISSVSAANSTSYEKILSVLLAWSVLVLLGLSIPETKKIRYILPALPPLAGLAAYALINESAWWQKWVRPCIEGLLLLLPLLIGIFVWRQTDKLLAAELDSTRSALGFLVLFLFSLGLAIYLRKNALWRPVALCFSAALSLLVLQISLLEPLDARLHDTRPFVQRVEALAADKPGKIVFYKENPDGLLIKYLVNARRDFSPSFQLEALKNQTSPIWLLTHARNWPDLQAAGVAHDALIYRETFNGEDFLVVYLPAPAYAVPAR